MTADQWEKAIQRDKMSDVSPGVELSSRPDPKLTAPMVLFWACTLGFIAGNAFMVYFG